VDHQEQPGRGDVYRRSLTRHSSADGLKRKALAAFVVRKSRRHRAHHVDLIDRAGFRAASSRRHCLSRRCVRLGVLGDGATIVAHPRPADLPGGKQWGPRFM